MINTGIDLVMQGVGASYAWSDDTRVFGIGVVIG